MGLPNSGIQYQQACLCELHSPTSAFSIKVILWFPGCLAPLSYVSMGSALGQGREVLVVGLSQTPRGAYFIQLPSAPTHTACRFVASFSPSQQTLCVPLWHSWKQTLGRHWPAQPIDRKWGPPAVEFTMDGSPDLVLRRKQSSEPTESTVPLHRAHHPCCSWPELGGYPTQE